MIRKACCWCWTLIHFIPMISFCTLWKHHKTYQRSSFFAKLLTIFTKKVHVDKFSDVFRGHGKKPVAWNGLNKIRKKSSAFLSFRTNNRQSNESMLSMFLQSLMPSYNPNNPVRLFGFSSSTHSWVLIHESGLLFGESTQS